MVNSPEISQQYEACLRNVGVYHRADRGLIELQGPDRAAWLNNLVTNVIVNLKPGEGNYAFAVNIKGRTVFDLNMLVLEDRIWLDIDRRLIENALLHLKHYLITEDVTLTDITEQSLRIAVLGPRAHEIVDKLGLGNLIPMAWLQHTVGQIEKSDVRMMRHDFAGIIGTEFLIQGENAEAATARIVAAAADLGAATVDKAAVEILRIEAGIPASVEDIDEDVVPPETGQIERGINYHKGCYLGQEVIERMRSHDILARRLIGFRFDGDEKVPAQSKVMTGEQEIGRVLSGCYSETLSSILCLGYVKTSHAAPDTPITVVTDNGERNGSMIDLPIRKQVE